MRWMLLAALLLLAAFAAGLDASNPRPIQAAPTALSVASPTFVGNEAGISFTIQDDLPAPATSSVVDIYASAAVGVGSFSGVGTIFGSVADADGVFQDGPTNRHTQFSDALVDGLDGANTAIHARNGTIGFSCDAPGVVTITITQQNTAGTVVSQSMTLNCVERVENPTKMVVVVNPESVTSCPANVLVSVQVQDITGNPLPDDTIVQFASDYGQLVPGPSGQMFGGWARVTLQLDVSTPPIVHMLANTLGLPAKRIDILATFSGPAITPTVVTFTISSESVECGKSAFIAGKVVDDDGANVADGTTVKVIAANGTVEPSETTTAAGLFTVTYKAPATAGEDTVTVAVKGLFKSTKVAVTCDGAADASTSGAAATAAGGAAAPGTTTSGAAGAGGTGSAAGTAGAAGATGTGSIRPPSTGDAGLQDAGRGSPAILGAVLVASMLCAASLIRRRA